MKVINIFIYLLSYFVCFIPFQLFLLNSFKQIKSGMVLNALQTIGTSKSSYMLEFVRRASKGEVVQDEISEKRKNIIMCKVNFEIF